MPSNLDVVATAYNPFADSWSTRRFEETQYFSDIKDEKVAYTEAAVHSGTAGATNSFAEESSHASGGKNHSNATVDEWQFPPMTVVQLAMLLENRDVRSALVQLHPHFSDIFHFQPPLISREENKTTTRTTSSFPPLLSKESNNVKRIKTVVHIEKENQKSDSGCSNAAIPCHTRNYKPCNLSLCHSPNATSLQKPSNAISIRSLDSAHSIVAVENEYRLHPKCTLKALGEYDMVELKVICDSFVRKTVGVCRILAIHSGITMYNLHRCIALALNIDKRAAEDYLHAWIVNDGTVYGGGKSCGPAMSRRLSLQTDRHTTYRQLVQLPVDEHGQVHPQSCAPLTYIFGKLQCQVTLNDFLLQQTNSADLLWVPRCCEGSYGSTPFFGNWMNFKSLETYSPQLDVDLDAVNL
ncbi:hypothetical protein IE077_001104 [Cardiosporidium cionae]|uniref:Uncharacterized protein n=1 Tax=Cardiosporidium cionae TaxID=476202 RepID=A0ABQ7JGL9_9APIC|nr:hypothetical protein IE077_001104 [Cardiosporidium cionae]|eukprot:KAF8823035.1 hypothetical protein IE077_001104 [Cardiosporidium cionae]